MMAISVENLPSTTTTAATTTAKVSVPASLTSSTSSTAASSRRESTEGCNDHKHEWTEYWENSAMKHCRSGPAVALQELLEDLRWLLPKGRCLVAGCGDGQDAVYLAKRGVTCVAIDFCEPAIAKAQKLLLESSDTVPAGKLTFSVQDFFTLIPPVRFTMAYECGLFSAIHPLQRQRWAETYARLIVPQGTLILLLCPLIHRSLAPPYQVTMAECERHLKRYFVLVRVDPNCKCLEGQEGNEIMSVWKRL
ncbi:hypothetical protein EDC05_000543 [Coemansia umbellata]|uniref:S-adenosyl-L-methionine-dependent methyltransferase n=1 Tax=Coemansia umbellata TaxID=1424467 RepID=A0ABQ8PUZ9_9FUNG|nr:hypothetical protein EDC05_000543 [Coemansia umbellata]